MKSLSTIVAWGALFSGLTPCRVAPAGETVSDGRIDVLQKDFQKDRRVDVRLNRRPVVFAASLAFSCFLQAAEWGTLSGMHICEDFIGHAPAADAADKTPMEPVRIAGGGKGFVLADSGKPFFPWGFNFVGDFGRILEEYWQEDWPRVERDFREMKKLGANVVRLHLQVGTYMKSPEEVDPAALDRLRRVLDLGREVGLYLDLTGLGCYHLKAVPPWYDGLSESDRWQVQARFWEAIARTSAGHPAVFCYDLMNEPVIGEPKEGEHPWLTGELGGQYFVQRISNKPGDRSREEIAAAWVEMMVTAIRKHDREHLVTVGVIPWALVWPTAKPLFYSPQVARHLDFVSVHFYPNRGEVDKALTALAVYDIGKPLVVEETFPLSCTLEELDQFIDRSGDLADGWISHYFGRTIAEHSEGAEPAGKLVAAFLEYWQKKAPAMTSRRP
jgi:hypothetical protein